MRFRSTLPAVLAIPGLGLAIAGLLHPHHLTYATSQRWWLLHVPGLLVFPLVGGALAWLVRSRTDPLAWAVRVAAYGYAVFYSALDVISGIGAGYVTHELGPGVARPDEVRLMFRIGTDLGLVGSWSLLACAVLVTVDAVRRGGLAGLPALALVPGAWMVHVDHIFSPVGATGMAIIGLTTGVTGCLLVSETPHGPPVTSQ